jgi:D-galactarolactone cycloisomerase
MKITGMRVRGGRLPHLSFVEVATDEGLVGIGSAGSPSHVIAPVVADAPGSLVDLLRGEDPRDTEALWRRMFQGWQALRGRGGEGGMAVNAMAAVDMALWDLKGKIAGEPLHRTLGGAVQPRILAYASATAFTADSVKAGRWVQKSTETLAAEAAGYRRHGFKAVKFGWSNYFSAADGEKLAAIREAVGPDVRLMFDFGCPAYWTPGWNVTTAVRAARMLEKIDAYFLEEPMSPQDVEGHARLAAAVEVNIATGESLSTFTEFQRYIERRAVDILQPDAAQIGVTQFRAVARASEAAGILVVPHSPWSALVVAAHVHLLSGFGNTPMVEYPAPSLLEGPTGRITRLAHQGIIERPLELVDGYVELPDGPGLGLGNYVPEALDEIEAAGAER